jgi:hypothetical protein
MIAGGGTETGSTLSLKKMRDYAPALLPPPATPTSPPPAVTSGRVTTIVSAAP